METGRKNKNEFLGMNVGTATARLKKNLMFVMAQRLGEDVCYRCDNKIETPEEMSIDHKKSWLYVDAGLFWDVANVGFSHRRCNKTDRPKLPKKHFPPEGMNWCCYCGFRPKEEFGPSSTGTGLRKECNACRKQRGWGHKQRKKK